MKGHATSKQRDQKLHRDDMVEMAQRGAVKVMSAETLLAAGAAPGLAMPASAAAEAVRIGSNQGVELTTLAMGLV